MPMSNSQNVERFDVAVVGGGPAGATAARYLAQQGHAVLLLDRPGRIKPCGGAIPPRCVQDFEIPDEMICATVGSARMVSPSDRHVDMPIQDGYVAMVDREVFDEWLRNRAAEAGAERREATFKHLEEGDGGVYLRYTEGRGGPEAETRQVWARFVIGADGANSAVGRQAIQGATEIPQVAAYHEIIEAPAAGDDDRFDPRRADVYYRGSISPDFYGWIFPHGDTVSVGAGSAVKGFSLRSAVERLRQDAGLEQATTLRREGAPIPMHPLKRWDNGRNVVLAGDAAGTVAPASGEGIYYAMVGGQNAAQAVEQALDTGDGAALAQAEKAFTRDHGQVFRVLGVMQRFWYTNNNRRERFVRICADPDVQALTWDAYMNKRLVRARPLAHMRIFFKNIAHLTGLAPVR
ncbi:geranylgeranyl diphosphate reductase [Halorhodospira halophila]|uniref:geranylgeranyl diphosphate reductase n=1 Tax=Halorhodospira halophila TaxID=1053 RepID=UPI001911F797|nr:geranylgeranyl diphosphate reductase [Halorhodospira halophila]MBK5936477.1 geranylgeranyl diphosphate reductase [Halorhodospira halophila]